MKKFLSLTAIALVASFAIPAVANASPHHNNGWHGNNKHHGHRGYDRGYDRHRSHSGLSLFFSSGPSYTTTRYVPVAQPVYVPQPVYYSAPYNSASLDNGYCREYTRNVIIGGRAQQAYGTSCLQPDGSWQIID